MFHELIGALVWLAANGLYIDLRRKGRRGLARILFFWMGMPATWVWLFLVPEGSGKAELPTARDDYQDLLEEIRKERALGAGTRADPGKTPKGGLSKSGAPGPMGVGDGRRKTQGPGADDEGAGHPEDDPHVAP